MKKIFWFALGFFFATLLFFALAYALGISLEKLGISLYDSEADQQRNFNIVIALWLLLGVFAGFFIASRKARKLRCIFHRKL